MKKNNLFLVSVFFGVLFSFFVSCKSVPNQIVSVKTIDLLDDEAALYIHIPAKNNEELMQSFIASVSKGANEKDANLIVSKLDNVFVAIGSKKDKKRLHIAADTIETIPNFAKTMLDKNTTFQSAVLSKNQIVIAKDIQPMVDLYDSEILNQENFRIDWKSSDLYNWISNNDSAIKFYIVRPQSFLANLLGTAMSVNTFKLNYARGKFEKLPNLKYELTLDLEFQEQRFVKPAISILILALGLTDSEIVPTSPTHIVLKGVHLSSKQLINMFGL